VTIHALRPSFVALKNGDRRRRNATGPLGKTGDGLPGSIFEWTRDDRLRQPVFLGIREDKAAQDVVREKAN
jgi:hypothetical protein